MTESMIERVASAMVEQPISEMHPEDRVAWIGYASRAIEAMREPTNEVHKAMCAAHNSPAAIWMAGIDAALTWPPGSADRAGVPMAED